MATAVVGRCLAAKRLSPRAEVGVVVVVAGSRKVEGRLVTGGGRVEREWDMGGGGKWVIELVGGGVRCRGLLIGGEEVVEGREARLEGR